MTMTRDEILKMPAGREMDKLIQSFVMGGLPPVRMDWIMSYIPNYSTNIAAAWEVMEEMRRRNRPISIYTSVGGWMTNFDFGAISSDESAPLAICRAALLAVQSASPTHDLP